MSIANRSILSNRESPDNTIVDIIDFDDSMTAKRYQPLTNNEEVLIREISSQDEESGIDDLCDIDKNIIREDIRNIQIIDKCKEYCLKICEYYSERVNILMKHIYRNPRLEDSEVRERETKIQKLLKEIDEYRMYENRLKELEIENSELKKVRIRLEEYEGKYRSIEKKYIYYKEVIDGSADEIEKLTLDDVTMWEAKLLSVMSKLNQRKTDICQEVMSKQQAVPKCVICQIKPINSILRNCNHACLCFECSLTVDKCPFDRMVSQSVDKIFLP